MKKLKSILFIISILLLSGCNLNYKVIVNENLTTSEELNLNVSKEALAEMKEKNGDNYIEKSLESYVNYFEDNNYVVKIDKNNLENFEAKKSNQSLVLNEKIMKARYNYYDFSCNNKYCLLYATADNNIIAGDGTGYDLAMTIKVPYRVLENNADKVNIIKNEYTWYSKSTNDNNDIKLVFLRDGANIPKRNEVLYFITIGIFAIIGLGILVFLIKIISKVIKNGRP